MSLSSCVHSFLATRGFGSAAWPKPTKNTPFLLGVVFIAYLVPQVAYIRSQAERPVLGQYQVGRLGASALEEWGGHPLGDPNADLKLVVFSDLICPACKWVVPRLIRQVRRNQHSYLVYRHFPLRSHSDARFAAAVSEVAAERGLFWEFVTYEGNGGMSRDDFLDNARKLGVPPNDLKRIESKEDKAWNAIGHDEAIAKSLDLPGTPMIILFRPGRKPRLVSPREAEIALLE